MTLSIDVSNNNGTVDFAAVKKAHPTLAIVGVKATEGRFFEDSTFAAHFNDAAARGLIVVPYHFARPDKEGGVAGGVAEADYFLADIKKYLNHKSLGRPALDYESVKDVAFAQAFAKRIEQKLGVKPLIYCSGSRTPEIASSLYLRSCPLWVAAYGSSYSQYVPKGMKVWMWQYTDSLDGKYDASQVFVHPSEFLLHKPPLYYIVDGKLHMVRPGKGRIKHFLHVKVGKLLAAGKVIKRLRRGK